MYPRIEYSAAAGGSPAAASSDEGAWPPAVDGAFFARVKSPVAVYVLRHGRTEANATSVFQGRLDYPLDAEGLAQASVAAAWLARRGVDRVLTSPMDRAASTAKIVAAACGLGEPLSVPSLMEVDVGPWSGVDWDTASKRDPDIFAEFIHRSWDAVPGAEHSSAMYERAVESWRRVRAEAEAGCGAIVCVSHGGLIQWLFRSTFGARSWLPLIPVANCGIFRFDIEPTGEGKPAFVQWSMVNFQAPDSRVQAQDPHATQRA